MKNKVSIKDISELAGVSIATVSRIINENGRYSKETEERVKRIIKEYNYIPNMVAKGLRTNRMTNIGIIIPDIQNEFFIKLTYQIEKNLFDCGYGTFICNTDENIEIEQKRIQMMKVQNVSGLIYISGGAGSAPTTAMEIPTVFIDRMPTGVGPSDEFVVIESDNFQGGYLATKELLESGCRNILMLTDKRRLSSQKQRIEGFQWAYEEAGLVFDSIYLVDLDKMDYTTAYTKVIELKKRGLAFDGIFATTDWLALGSYAALHDFGTRVPEEVKIVGYDDISIAEFNALPLTTIHQQIDMIAEYAVKYLLQLMEGKPVIERLLKIPVYLVKRQST